MCGCGFEPAKEEMAMPMIRTPWSRSWNLALWLGLTALVARAGAKMLATRERQAPTAMVDWQMALRTAQQLLPVGFQPPEYNYQTLVDDAAPHVAQLTGLQVPAGALNVRVVDQQAWVAANVRTFAQLMQPLEPVYFAQLHDDTSDWGLTARHLNGRVAGVQSGALLSWMAARVLGQYDVAFLQDSQTPGELLLVEPNIARIAREQQVDVGALRQWIVIHEVSHVFQFEGVAWLRPYLRDLMTRFMQTMADQMRHPSSGVAAVMQRAVQRGGQGNWIEWVLSPAQRQIFDEMQAVMSLIEGHSNYVMNRIGAQQIPQFGELQRRIEARRQQRPTLDNLIMHATGMHIKMAQYSTGEAFVNAIAAHGGDDLVAQLWQSAAQIPTAAELVHPDQWVRRV
ncbi:MAG: hypothetical protein DWI30_03250 [Chloroflexi bacterium]|nr:MAG: hypothetical protein DWI30_03250 [Chloroflexota bacterium]